MTEQRTTEEALPQDVQDLAAAIAALPQPYCQELGPLVSRVISSAKRRRKILNLVQDALSQLRVDMKYLMFDLDATRRERDEYKHQLEELM